MSIALPTSPQPNAAVPSYLDWGGVLTPVFGGADQKLNRLGDRFALDVTMPEMRSADLGMGWVAKLILGQRQGVILPWPQPGFLPGTPGSPVVNGAGQAGSTLLLRGFAPRYAVRLGQFFSIVHGGRRYLHMAAADAAADADGNLSLAIAPMLRVSPANGAICEFAVPMIEGLLEGNTRDWNLTVAQTTGLSFRIKEAR